MTFGNFLSALPLHHDILYGAFISSLLHDPVPRICWPEKPKLGSVLVLVVAQFGR